MTYVLSSWPIPIYEIHPGVSTFQELWTLVMSVLVPIFQQAYSGGSVGYTFKSGIPRLHQMPEAIKTETRRFVFWSGRASLDIKSQMQVSTLQELKFAYE